MAPCPICNSAKEASENYSGDACELLISGYILAGLAMMLNIRLSYSSAPYALIRFRLPENLFSVFVRRMASALELWCLPSMLLGNIMDLIQKLIDKNPELRAIKVKADDIKEKVGTLKDTAESQSGIELGHTNMTDLQGGNAQSGLSGKAGQLQTKASGLYGAAHALEQVATGPLQPLSGLAKGLKDADGNDESNGGLFQAANQLEQARTVNPATEQANGVIEAFESVDTQYTKLMDAYNNILKDPAQAAKLSSEDKDKVTAVVKKYHEVKNTYYQMLIIYRIKNKADAFHRAAHDLKQAAKAENNNQKLAALQQKASLQMQQLDIEAIILQSIKLGEPEATIVQYYLAVADKYNALADKPEFTAALKEPQVTAVKEKFNALQKSYENVLKLRVQELSNLAITLYEKANVLSGDSDIGTEARSLRDAASKTGGDDQGLKQKADALRDAIKGGTDADAPAKKVIDQFEAVQRAYEALKAKAKEKKKQPNVQAVEEAYNALKKVYDKILNFTKMKQPAIDLEAKAQSIADPDTAQQFKDSLDKFGKIYDSITDADIKSTVQNEFESIKNVINGEMKWWKFIWIIIPSIITQWLNFLTYVLLLAVYLMGGDTGHLTLFYFVIAISGVVFGINMTLVYSVDFYYIPVYIAGENTFPALTSFIHYMSTLIFGNRRKWNSDFLIVYIDIGVAILISLVAAVVWTYGYLCEISGKYHEMKHIHANKFDGKFNWYQISPFLMIVVGMGLVFTIYPGIAPGMIVPFYLIDKIEMVLLIATIFPPVIIAVLRLKAKAWSPQHNLGGSWGLWKEYEKPAWENGGTVYGWIWHFFDILMVIKISLGVIFIYSLHYRDSSIARSIINQPKMSTFLSITFYMCHEILLAVGFSGFIGNDGGDYILIPQYIGALFMIFLAFYSEGYIIEYKSHDPAHWPTTGMTPWNAFCYWRKNARKIANKNFKSGFDNYRDNFVKIIKKNTIN